MCQLIDVRADCILAYHCFTVLHKVHSGYQIKVHIYNNIIKIPSILIHCHLDDIFINLGCGSAGRESGRRVGCSAASVQ